MLMVACGTANKSQSEEEKVVSIEFSADSAYNYCAAQCQYGPRTMNSEAHEKCGEWIAEQFKKYVTTELQEGLLLLKPEEFERSLSGSAGISR